MSAVELQDVRDTGISYDDQGRVRITRTKMFCADSIMALYNSKLLPMRGSRHPDNSRFKLDSSSCEPVGNVGGPGQRWQFLWTGEYSASGWGGSGGGGGDDDKEPWDLGAQDVRYDTFSSTVPMTEVYDPADKTGQQSFNLVNSANCPFALEHDVYGRELSFSFAVKNSPNLNDDPLINAESINVAGIGILQYGGLLMPMSASKIVEYDDHGEKKREYWQINVTIRMAPNSFKKGWKRAQLDVGTLAFDAADTSSAPREAQPIYRYFPWTSVDPTAKQLTKPSFGSINAVAKAQADYALIAARAKYGQSLTVASMNAEQTAYYYQAFQDLPFSEVTEPLPLNNGFVWQQAIKDPKNNPYHKIEYFEYAVADWKQYDLPAAAEGEEA